MITSKKLILALFLGSIASQTIAMSLEGLKEHALQKLSTASAYIPEPVKKAATVAWKHKLATAATLAMGGVAVTYATGYNPLKSLLPAPGPRYQNFHDWKKACDTTCTSLHHTPLTSDEFEKELENFITSAKQEMANEDKWIQNITSENKTLNEKQHRFFRVEKLEIQPGTEVAFHGDIHGDIHSFNAFIADLAKKGYMDPSNPFKIKKPNFKIIMLGDYTDRGHSGAEVLYTIMRLKRLNPDQFFMVRGNHEDTDINRGYGFSTELNLKKFDFNHLKSQLYELYHKLPVALYLVSGTQNKKNALLCCHGGLEIGSADVKTILDDKRPHCYMALDYLTRKCCAESLPNEYKPCISQLNEVSLFDGIPFFTDQIGYMWSDFNFTSNNDKGQAIEAHGPRLKLPEQLTKYLLEKDSTPTCKLRGVIRAHQHDHETMPRILNHDGKSDAADAGVAKLWLPEGTQQPAGKLWDGMVCTFCVSPNTTFGSAHNYNFDTYGILKTAQSFEDWRLDITRLVTGK